MSFNPFETVAKKYINLRIIWSNWIKKENQKIQLLRSLADIWEMKNGDTDRISYLFRN